MQELFVWMHPEAHAPTSCEPSSIEKLTTCVSLGAGSGHNLARAKPGLKPKQVKNCIGWCEPPLMQATERGLKTPRT